MALWRFGNLNKYGVLRTKIVHTPTSQLKINPDGFGRMVTATRFKYTYTHSIIPPALVTILDKKYIVPTWKEVLPQTTLEDINWVKPQIKEEKPKVENPKVWEFESSSGNGKYQVRINKSGNIICNCSGFFRVKDKAKGCKHVQQVRKEIS